MRTITVLSESEDSRTIPTWDKPLALYGVLLTFALLAFYAQFASLLAYPDPMQNAWITDTAVINYKIMQYPSHLSV